MGPPPPAESEFAISASHIVKRFRPSGGATSLKERLLRRRSSASRQPFTALADVSLDIASGHTVGLIGHNGSGKSTLLKILAGILRPTSGTVQVRGRIASLLELGAGFNGELNGRENVYLNASLLGLSRAETDQLYQSIVDFAELHEFMEEPVKHYSSGMYVRLGFAVAVHVDPDILLVDEVLAVGDEAFATKCLVKIEQFQKEGRTILVVSHSMDLIERVCDRAIVLDHGTVIFDGDPEFATGTLRLMLGTTPRADDSAEPDEPLPPSPVEILAASVHTGADEPEAVNLVAGQAVTIRIAIRVDVDAVDRCGQVSTVVMGLGRVPIMILRHREPPVGLTAEGGLWEIRFHIPALPPINGAMLLAVQVHDGQDQPLATLVTTKGFSIGREAERDGLVSVDYSSIATTRTGSLT